MVRPHQWGCPEDRKGFHRGSWCDPIGAAYSQWDAMNNKQRLHLMLKTAIDLTMQGFSMANVLRAFAEVPQFRALGSESFPMCRALTAALVGHCLEPNTMDFEELLKHYGKEKNQLEV